MNTARNLIQDRDTIVTTIARRVMKARNLDTARILEVAAGQGWDEARGGTQHDYPFGTACGAAYDRGYWAAKNYETLDFEKLVECL